MLIIDAKSDLRRTLIQEKMFELAKISLAWFVKYRFAAEGRALLWNWHLDCICEHLEAVTTGQLSRLMINMPPRFLKTEVAAECWPAWMLGRDNSPKSSMVSASYSTSLAARASLRTLNMINRPWFRYLFPGIQMVKSTAVEWETTEGCSRVATGSGGTITGKGGDKLLGDDLLKPKDANSEIVRESVNEWQGETFHSRLNDPKVGAKVLIGQRVHERDPFGYLTELMKNPDAEQWTKLNLPLENIDGKPVVYRFAGGSKPFTYIRKKNELLHPERLGERQVKQAKVLMRANFEGQYNQRPNKMEGGLLRPSLLVEVDKTPQAMIRDWGLTPLAYIDLAAKEKQRHKDDPDWTVIEIWARDQLQRKILLHVWRQQCSMNVAAGVLYDLRKTWGIRWVKGEKGPLQHAFRSQMLTTARLRKISSMGVLDFGESLGDKGLKVAPFEADLNAGIVVVPKAATWLPDYTAEMRSWPKGAHDDQVDLSGQACNDLDNWAGGEVPVPEDGPADPANVTGAALRKHRRQQEQQKGPGWRMS